VVLQEHFLHVMRVHIDRAGLDGAGHDDAVAVEDVAATGEENGALVLLPLGPLDRLLPADGLEPGHPADEQGEEHGNARQDCACPADREPGTIWVAAHAPPSSDNFIGLIGKTRGARRGKVGTRNLTG